VIISLFDPLNRVSKILRENRYRYRSRFTYGVHGSALIKDAPTRCRARLQPQPCTMSIHAFTSFASNSQAQKWLSIVRIFSANPSISLKIRHISDRSVLL
jgi:hypothetical protein